MQVVSQRNVAVISFWLELSSIKSPPKQWRSVSLAGFVVPEMFSFTTPCVIKTGAIWWTLFTGWSWQTSFSSPSSVYLHTNSFLVSGWILFHGIMHILNFDAFKWILLQTLSNIVLFFSKMCICDPIWRWKCPTIPLLSNPKPTIFILQRFSKTVFSTFLIRKWFAYVTINYSHSFSSSIKDKKTTTHNKTTNQRIRGKSSSNITTLTLSDLSPEIGRPFDERDTDI